MSVIISIDPGAGPCFGVQRAIHLAEGLLSKTNPLACLGDLIHNEQELNRLKEKGLKVVSHCQIVEQSGSDLLVRAHGEPPSTYRIAEAHQVNLVDATCPIVKQLQEKIKEASERMEIENGQVLLFGDLNHAEVAGLKGYSKGRFSIIRSVEDLENIRVDRPSVFFSQTTKYTSEYHKIVEVFKEIRAKENANHYFLEVVDSQCHFVAKRDKQLIEFLKENEVLIFVSGSNSSNGNYLYKVAKRHLERAYFISTPTEINLNWIRGAKSIGISGATSTPYWQLELTKSRIKELIEQD
ncbi:MAG: 4-hydroxy-3-methylbut-2-enyl diphosphate reductase [Bacteroidales bacterium]|nr:4-hydroxy-3-methylbut-2-enyl diphosphate reductase [Bacteroidales bacterium]